MEAEDINLITNVDNINKEEVVNNKVEMDEDQVEVDEAMFLGGLAKGAFLREFEPDFFFDDQTGHVNSAAQHVPSGHVSSGIANSPAHSSAPSTPE